jgi:hypothetical protein
MNHPDLKQRVSNLKNLQLEQRWQKLMMGQIKNSQKVKLKMIKKIPLIKIHKMLPYKKNKKVKKLQNKNQKLKLLK